MTAQYAVSQIRSGPVKDRILNFLRVTGNSHTARELAGILSLSTGTVRRRLTDLSKAGKLRVTTLIKGPTREERVYRVR